MEHSYAGPVATSPAGFVPSSVWDPLQAVGLPGQSQPLEKLLCLLEREETCKIGRIIYFLFDARTMGPIKATVFSIDRYSPRGLI